MEVIAVKELNSRATQFLREARMNRKQNGREV